MGVEGVGASPQRRQPPLAPPETHPPLPLPQPQASQPA